MKGIDSGPGTSIECHGKKNPTSNRVVTHWPRGDPFNDRGFKKISLHCCFIFWSLIPIRNANNSRIWPNSTDPIPRRPSSLLGQLCLLWYLCYGSPGYRPYTPSTWVKNFNFYLRKFPPPKKKKKHFRFF